MVLLQTLTNLIAVRNHLNLLINNRNLVKKENLKKLDDISVAIDHYVIEKVLEIEDISDLVSTTDQPQTVSVDVPFEDIIRTPKVELESKEEVIPAVVEEKPVEKDEQTDDQKTKPTDNEMLNERIAAEKAKIADKLKQEKTKKTRSSKKTSTKK